MKAFVIAMVLLMVPQCVDAKTHKLSKREKQLLQHIFGGYGIATHLNGDTLIIEPVGGGNMPCFCPTSSTPGK